MTLSVFERGRLILIVPALRGFTSDGARATVAAGTLGVPLFIPVSGRRLFLEQDDDKKNVARAGEPVTTPRTGSTAATD